MTPPVPISYLADRAGLLAFLVQLRRATRRCAGIDDCLDVALRARYRNWHITPNQVRSEIRDLLQVLAAGPPRRVLEIGTSLGGTLYLFSRVSAPDALLVSVDLPAHHTPLRRVLLRSFAAPGQRVCLLTGDSQQPTMRDQVLACLGGDAVDFLFIDGDHSYQGARRDFELYRPLVRPGGRVTFHDIVSGAPERVGGVPRLWQEVRTAYPSRELVANWQQGGFGIGLLEMP